MQCIAKILEKSLLLIGKKCYQTELFEQFGWLNEKTNQLQHLIVKIPEAQIHHKLVMRNPVDESRIETTIGKVIELIGEFFWTKEKFILLTIFKLLAVLTRRFSLNASKRDLLYCFFKHQIKALKPQDFSRLRLPKSFFGMILWT